MKKIPTKTMSIKSKVMTILQNMWAETIMIGMLVVGIHCLVFLALILSARLVGLQSSDSFLLIPDSISPVYIGATAAVVLAAYLIYAPLYFGIKWYFWQAVCGKPMPLSSIFASYSSGESIIKCIKLKLSVDIRIAVIGAVLSVPVYFTFRLAADIRNSYEHTTAEKILLAAGCIVVALCLYILFVLIKARYIPVGYIFADDPDFSTSEIIKKSIRIMKKKTPELMLTYLSCYRTILCAVFIMPIIFIIPFMYMISAMFIHQSLNENSDNEHEQEEKKEHAFA